MFLLDVSWSLNKYFVELKLSLRQFISEDSSTKGTGEPQQIGSRGWFWTPIQRPEDHAEEGPGDGSIERNPKTCFPGTWSNNTGRWLLKGKDWTYLTESVKLDTTKFWSVVQDNSVLDLILKQ